MIPGLEQLAMMMGPEALASLAGEGAAGAGLGGMKLSEALAPAATETMAGRAMPMSQPISEATITGQPSGLQNAADWKARMMGANQALRFASKFINHKPTKNMLNLMSMTSGAAMNVDDPSKLMSQMEAPLTDIAATVQPDQRLSQATQQPKVAPSTAMQPAGGPVGEAPAAKVGMAAMPPTRLTEGMPMMPGRDEIMRRIRGY